jgi:hypothetical protein
MDFIYGIILIQHIISKYITVNTWAGFMLDQYVKETSLEKHLMLNTTMYSDNNVSIIYN